MDRVDNNTYRELMQFDLRTGEYRALVLGDEPFDSSQDAIATVAMLGDKDRKELGEGLRSDSDLDVRIPSTDLDSADSFRVKMIFLIGPRPLVLFEADEPLPGDVIYFAADAAQEGLKRIDLKARGYQRAAQRPRNVGRWVLEGRTTEIESSVRKALDDEDLSEDDYLALRRYPERLALVEELCQEVRSHGAQWNSHQPQGRYANLAVPSAPDPFWKHLDEAEANARNAVTRLSGLISSQQVVLARRQAQQTERFQRLVTLIGAAVLVPGLVAGIFGANLDFPGKNTTSGLLAMLCLMAAGGIGSYTLIRWLESEHWRTMLEGDRLRKLTEMRLAVKLALLGTLAALLVCIAIVLLVVGG